MIVSTPLKLFPIAFVVFLSACGIRNFSTKYHQVHVTQQERLQEAAASSSCEATLHASPKVAAPNFTYLNASPIYPGEQGAELGIEGADPNPNLEIMNNVNDSSSSAGSGCPKISPPAGVVQNSKLVPPKQEEVPDPNGVVTANDNDDAPNVEVQSSSSSSESSSAGSSASSLSSSAPSLPGPVGANSSSSMTGPGVDPKDPFQPSMTAANPTMRILIFPHVSRWDMPQGREKVITQVTFTTTGSCSEYAGTDSFFKNANSTGQKFSYNTAQFSSPVYLRCDSPTKLLRDAGQTSFEYQGIFYIQKIKSPLLGNYMQVIQLISLEEYLKGVVPSEMPALWHKEALTAQAVAARSYALFKYRSELAAQQAHKVTRNYDLDDTVFYQAYTGLSNQSPITNQLIDDSAGKVITYQNKVIAAYFSADSGGYTESAVQVWGKNLAYTPSKPEIYDLSQVKSAWTVTAKGEDLEKSLGLTIPIRGVSIDKPFVDQSGRVSQLKFDLSDGTSKNIPALQVTAALELRSRLFTVSFNNDLLTINGRGYGHGVGMNQSGADVLARTKNWTADQILNFYFSNVSLVTLK